MHFRWVINTIKYYNAYINIKNRFINCFILVKFMYLIKLVLNLWKMFFHCCIYWLNWLILFNHFHQIVLIFLTPSSENDTQPFRDHDPVTNVTYMDSIHSFTDCYHILEPLLRLVSTQAFTTGHSRSKPNAMIYPNLLGSHRWLLPALWTTEPHRYRHLFNMPRNSRRVNFAGES